MAKATMEIPAEWVREFRIVVLIELGGEGEELTGIDYLELDEHGIPGKRRGGIAAYRRITEQLGPLAELVGFQDQEPEAAVSVALAEHGPAVRHVLKVEVKRIAERKEEQEPKGQAWVSWITQQAEEILDPPAEVATAGGEA